MGLAVRNKVSSVDTVVELVGNALLQWGRETEIVHVNVGKWVSRGGIVDVLADKVSVAIKFFVASSRFCIRAPGRLGRRSDIATTGRGRGRARGEDEAIFHFWENSI